MKEWYIAELKKHIPPLIDRWKKIMDKRIWKSLELVMKPPHCLEYIIVHERAHLIESGHDARFKTLMDKYYPDWRIVKAKLNGKLLT